MSDEIRAHIKRHFDEMNRGNIDEMDELLAPDVLRHMPPLPDIRGVEMSKQLGRDLQTSYPDRHQIIDEIIVEGDVSAVRWTFRGTNTGPSQYIPTPTNKQVTYKACWIAHWKDGKIVEDWLFQDMLGMMQQLDLIPTPSQG